MIINSLQKLNLVAGRKLDDFVVDLQKFCHILLVGHDGGEAIQDG